MSSADAQVCKLAAIMNYLLVGVTLLLFFSNIVFVYMWVRCRRARDKDVEHQATNPKHPLSPRTTNNDNNSEPRTATATETWAGSSIAGSSHTATAVMEPSPSLRTTLYPRSYQPPEPTHEEEVQAYVRDLGMKIEEKIETLKRLHAEAAQLWSGGT